MVDRNGGANSPRGPTIRSSPQSSTICSNKSHQNIFLSTTILENQTDVNKEIKKLKTINANKAVSMRLNLPIMFGPPSNEVANLSGLDL